MHRSAPTENELIIGAFDVTKQALLHICFIKSGLAKINAKIYVTARLVRCPLCVKSWHVQRKRRCPLRAKSGSCVTYRWLRRRGRT